MSQKPYSISVGNGGKLFNLEIVTRIQQGDHRNGRKLLNLEIVTRPSTRRLYSISVRNGGKLLIYRDLHEVFNKEIRKKRKKLLNLKIVTGSLIRRPYIFHLRKKTEEDC